MLCPDSPENVFPAADACRLTDGTWASSSATVVQQFVNLTLPFIFQC